MRKCGMHTSHPPGALVLQYGCIRCVYGRIPSVYGRIPPVYGRIPRVYGHIHLTHSGYTAVCSRVYGRILGGMWPYTHGICCQFQSILTSSLLEFHPSFLCRSSMIPGHCGASLITKWPSLGWSWWRRGLLRVKWSPVGVPGTHCTGVGGGCQGAV